MRPLVWFRSDLRIRDNPALSEACRAADDGVVAVFAICPLQWREHDWAPVKVDFLMRHLAELSAALAELRIPLLILRTPRFDSLPQRLLGLAKKHGCSSLWFNEEWEVNERRRDAAVLRHFEGRHQPVHTFNDQTIVPPGSLRTGQGNFYTVFGPFRKRWIAAVRTSGVRCRRAPHRQRQVKISPSAVPARIQGFSGGNTTRIWGSGEPYALTRLKNFLSKRVVDYHEARDVPSVNGTSALSPYLALGAVSARQCLRAALAANRNRLDSGSQGVVTWISELIWRDFYRHVLVGFPRVSMNQPFDLRTRELRWRRSASDLARWKEGRTGIPIVDAGMRQLAATGWMHNRLRMISAMFLTKNLLIDWREGERHFMRNLIDGDLASNNGGWQWSASTGTDAAPYFRVFNPVSQSERYDPHGAFIRTYLPELAGIEGSALHHPHERAAAQARAADYPRPIVDLRASRQRAIEAFRAIRT